MARFLSTIGACARGIASLLVVAMLVVTLAQVFFRFVLNDSLLWSEELSRYLNVWIAMLGAAVIAHEWGHTNMSMFVEKVPVRARLWLMTVAKLVSIAFFIFLLLVGWSLVVGPFHLNSATMGFSTRWVKLSFPVAGGLMLLFGIGVVARDLRAIRRGDFDHFQRQGQLTLD
jgi:TRAP-type C4-dicarboxylate transport system permease small subunit